MTAYTYDETRWTERTVSDFHLEEMGEDADLLLLAEVTFHTNIDGEFWFESVRVTSVIDEHGQNDRVGEGALDIDYDWAELDRIARNEIIQWEERYANRLLSSC